MMDGRRLILTGQFLIMIVGLIGQRVDAQIRPMVCPSTATPMVFDLTIKTTCIVKPHAPNITITEATAKVYKKNLAMYSSDAVKCWKVRTTLEAWTSFGQFNFFTKQPRHENIYVNEHECRRMVEKSECEEGRLIGSKEAGMTENSKEYPYTNGLDHNSGLWKSDSYINCFFMSGKMVKRFDAEPESNLGAVRSCQYEREECTLPDKSLIMWKVNRTASKEYVLFDTFHGKRWNDQFLTDARDVGFTWSKTSRNVELEPGRWGVLTDQGVAIYVVNNQIIPDGQPRGKRDLEASAMTASRLQGLDFRLMDIYNGLNRDLNAFCNVQREMMEMDLIHSHATPTLTARRLLNNTLIHGRISGSILQVRPCRFVDDFTVQMMPGPLCVGGIPINYTVDGKNYHGLMDPGTAIVSQSAEPTDCHFMNEVFMLDAANRPFLYERRLGTIGLYRGTLRSLQMYDLRITGFADMKMVIHRSFDMYDLHDAGGLTTNDYFERMHVMDTFLQRLQNLQRYGEPTDGFMKSVLDGIRSIHPFGHFSPDLARVHWIWVNICCGAVTIQLLWLFLVPGKIKKAVDKMTGFGKDRVNQWYLRMKSMADEATDDFRQSLVSTRMAYRGYQQSGARGAGPAVQTTTATAPKNEEERQAAPPGYAEASYGPDDRI